MFLFTLYSMTIETHTSNVQTIQVKQLRFMIGHGWEVM